MLSESTTTSNQSLTTSQPPPLFGNDSRDGSSPISSEIYPARNKGNHLNHAFECLIGVDKVLIHQHIKPIEVLTKWEASNAYAIKAPDGRELFQVTEDSGILARQLCGSLRSFCLNVTDTRGLKVACMKRDFHCISCILDCHACCFCCMLCCEPMQEITLETPSGEVVGKVQDKSPLCAAPKFDILDNEEGLLLRIRGPKLLQLMCRPINCCQWKRPLEFKIMSTDGAAELGVISREWTGFCQRLITNADDYSITFPSDLDSNSKMLILAAVFLLDFMYFEREPKWKKP